MDKAVEAVIEAVKTASPTLWAAAQAKVQADIQVSQLWMNVSGVVFTISALLLVFSIVMSIRNSYGDDGYGVLGGVSLLASLLFLVIFLISYSNIIAIKAAPQWYAIKALAELSPLK